MDRLASLSVFVKIVESGGFSAAARRLGLSPAMVSNHLQALEAHLGVRLLNRSTRRVSLTEVGQAYYEQCSRILLALDEADQGAAVMQATPTGRLRLNASPALGPLLAPVVADYLTLHPGMQVEAIMSDRMVDLVEEGFDLAIRMTPVPDSRMIIRRLSGYRHVLCAAPEYLARVGTPRVPADLADHTCMRHAVYPFGDEWRFDGPDGEHVVRVHGNLLTNSSSLVRLAALRGHGVMLYPRFLIPDDLAAGRLVALMEEYVPRELMLEVVYPHRLHLSAKVRLFIDMLVEQLGPDRPID